MIKMKKCIFENIKMMIFSCPTTRMCTRTRARSGRVSECVSLDSFIGLNQGIFDCALLAFNKKMNFELILSSEVPMLND